MIWVNFWCYDLEVPIFKLSYLYYIFTNDNHFMYRFDSNFLFSAGSFMYFSSSRQVLDDAAKICWGVLLYAEILLILYICLYYRLNFCIFKGILLQIYEVLLQVQHFVVPVNELLTEIKQCPLSQAVNWTIRDLKTIKIKQILAPPS